MLRRSVGELWPRTRCEQRRGTRKPSAHPTSDAVAVVLSGSFSSLERCARHGSLPASAARLSLPLATPGRHLHPPQASPGPQLLRPPHVGPACPHTSARTERVYGGVSPGCPGQLPKFCSTQGIMKGQIGSGVQNPNGTVPLLEGALQQPSASGTLSCQRLSRLCSPSSARCNIKDPW